MKKPTSILTRSLLFLAFFLSGGLFFLMLVSPVQAADLCGGGSVNECYGIAIDAPCSGVSNCKCITSSGVTSQNGFTKYYICKAESTLKPPKPLPPNAPSTGPSCLGQCKGQASGNHAVGTICIGMNDMCYSCQSSGQFITVSSDQCGAPNAGGGAVATPTPIPKKNCGEPCQSDSDCRNPSTGGFPTVCRKQKSSDKTGVCEQAACPAGQTQPGSICGCNAKQQCGQPCGPAAGNSTCEQGSECGFITPQNQCIVNGSSDAAKQFCLPKADTIKNGYKLNRCSGIVAQSLVKANGSQTNLTPQDVLIACGKTSATPLPPAPATPVCSSVSWRKQTAGAGGTWSDGPGPYKIGEKVTFQIKQPVAAGNYRYEGKCAVIRNGQTIQTFGLTTKTVRSNTFDAVRVMHGNATYQCSFRICATGNEQTTCSDWAPLAQ